MGKSGHRQVSPRNFNASDSGVKRFLQKRCRRLFVVPSENCTTSEITHPSIHLVAAKGDAGPRTCEFQPRSVTIAAARITSGKILFYLAVALNAAAMMDGAGNTVKTPVKLTDQPTPNPTGSGRGHQGRNDRH